MKGNSQAKVSLFQTSEQSNCSEILDRERIQGTDWYLKVTLHQSGPRGMVLLLRNATVIVFISM